MDTPTDDLLGRLKGCTLEHLPDLPEVLRQQVDEAQSADEVSIVVFDHVNEIGNRKGWGFEAITGQYEETLSEIADLAGLNDWPA